MPERKDRGLPPEGKPVLVDHYHPHYPALPFRRGRDVESVPERWRLAGFMYPDMVVNQYGESRYLPPQSGCQ